MGQKCFSVHDHLQIHQNTARECSFESKFEHLEDYPNNTDEHEKGLDETRYCEITQSAGSG